MQFIYITNFLKILFLNLLYIKGIFSSIKGYIYNNEIILKSKLNLILKLIFFLKKHSYFQYKILSDLCCIDYLEKKYRFEIVYNFLSIVFNSRITLTCFMDEFTKMDSISKIHKSAGWFEREAWDMFGVFFKGNEDLRRILSDYGFKGHAMQKNFPLVGFYEVNYNNFYNIVRHFEISLSQDYRRYLYNN